MRTWVRRVLRTAKRLATSNDLPKWLRGLFAFGLLPIPVIPIDEAALVLAVALMALFHRPALKRAWRESACS
jgi:hypothetical protein